MPSTLTASTPDARSARAATIDRGADLAHHEDRPVPGQVGDAGAVEDGPERDVGRTGDGDHVEPGGLADVDEHGRRVDREPCGELGGRHGRDVVVERDATDAVCC